MRAVSPSGRSKPTLSVNLQIPAVGGVKSNIEDAVKDSVKDHVHEEVVTIRPSGPKRYECEEVWLTIVQVDEIQKPLHAVSQRQESDLLESLKVTKYQQGTGLNTVASSSLGKLGAVTAKI